MEITPHEAMLAATILFKLLDGIAEENRERINRVIDALSTADHIIIKDEPDDEEALQGSS